MIEAMAEENHTRLSPGRSENIKNERAHHSEDNGVNFTPY
jgi:hypothetical protein